jgi:hypothetical protein
VSPIAPATQEEHLTALFAITDDVAQRDQPEDRAQPKTGSAGSGCATTVAFPIRGDLKARSDPGFLLLGAERAGDHPVTPSPGPLSCISKPPTGDWPVKWTSPATACRDRRAAAGACPPLVHLPTAMTTTNLDKKKKALRPAPWGTAVFAVRRSRVKVPQTGTMHPDVREVGPQSSGLRNFVPRPPCASARTRRGAALARGSIIGENRSSRD